MSKLAMAFIMNFMFLNFSAMKQRLFPVNAEPTSCESQVVPLRDSDKSMGKLCALARMFEKGEERIVCASNWSRLAYIRAQLI